jgi:hypothetical protein
LQKRGGGPEKNFADGKKSGATAGEYFFTHHFRVPASWNFAACASRIPPSAGSAEKAGGFRH